MSELNPRRTFNQPGDIHALTFSTFRRHRLLSEPWIADLFLQSLSKSREKFNFEVWAYVLMPDHVHLLLWPRSQEYKMETIRQSIKTPISKAVLKVARETGEKKYQALLHKNRPRFWQAGSGYDRNLLGIDEVRECVDYIHANPLRAGMCSSPTEYPWSSAQWYADSRASSFQVDPYHF
jgi:putative transposase